MFNATDTPIIPPANANIPEDNNEPRDITAVRPARAVTKANIPWDTVSHGNEPRIATGTNNTFIAAAIDIIPAAPFNLSPKQHTHDITPISTDTANTP